MDVVFGLWADADAWPEHAGKGNAALGAPVVGPRGFLEILETARGLGRPETPNVIRIAKLQAALEAMSGPDRFWSRSLAVDGWATARILLRWRDELVDAGWIGPVDWRNQRLIDMDALFAATDEVANGIPDRVRALIENLADGASLLIKRVRLIDQRDFYPASWRRLFESLELCGVTVEAVLIEPAASEATALGKLQRWLTAAAPIEGRPDGTVTIAATASAALAAEVTAHWFAESSEREVVLIAQGADTHLLDHGLRLAGQPRAGRSRASAHRWALQILLLGFKAAWTPFDPRAIMELVAFPASPIAPRAGRRLAAALEEAPGRGGEHWVAAWSEIDTAERAAAGNDPVAVRRANARLARWRAWADPETADPVEGMTLPAALAICDRTIAWALARHAHDEDALFSATAMLASYVREALAALGRERLPRTLVERIIDQALDIGHDNPSAEAEAAPWRCVSHPGSVWAPADTVIWWNFGTTDEASRRQPWTDEEHAELAERGCPLDDPSLAARAANAAWERAVLNARRLLVFVTAGLDAGSDEALHPLAYRIAPATEALANSVRMEDALANDRVSLAGLELPRTPVDFAPQPVARSVWPTPKGFSDRLQGIVHSATSFENGLSCQLSWALKHVARLRPGRVRSIPDSNQLLGNLAHALAREIFAPGAPPTPDEAAGHARERLEALIDEMAAPLRLPEFATQLSDARDRLPAALAALARTLCENRLNVEACEQQVSATFDDAFAVRGAVDLIARDENGRHVIVDLKWTRSAARRRAELESGKAVQLATYGSMVAGQAPYRAGYFLLGQRQFATLADGGLIGRAIAGERSLPETWQALCESWRRLGDVAAAGSLVACGVEGSDAHLPDDLSLRLEANCRWCEYQTICRVRGLT